MASNPTGRTLREDWQARLDRLASLPHTAGGYHAVEMQLLEYLLQRYRNAPEGTRTARFPLRSELYINHRALVVFHHLADGRFPTMTSASQTREHVKSVLQRMASQPTTTGTAEDLESAWPGAAPSEDRSVDALRMKLCDSDSRARVEAIVALSEVGTLDDVGLLSDLLSLPTFADEHPLEREAIMHTLKRLAGMTTSKFQLPAIESASSSKNVDDSNAEPPANLLDDPSFGLVSKISRPNWICTRCTFEVPGGFDRCWKCGTSIEGDEGGRFEEPHDRS